MKSIYEKDLLDTYLKQMRLDTVFTEKAKKSMYLQVFDHDETVIHNDGQISSLSILMKGRVKVIPFSGEGKDALIDYIGQEELLGDIEYFCGGTSVHGVVSVGQSVTLQVPYQVIESELKGHPPFLLYMAQKLASKLHTSSKRHSNLLLYSTKIKLCRYILERLEERGETHIPVKNSELAQILGSSDRHIRRLIGELIEEGVIQKERRGYIRIIDIESLQEKVKR